MSKFKTMGSDVNPDMVMNPPAGRAAKATDGARCDNPTHVHCVERHGPRIGDEFENNYNTFVDAPNGAVYNATR